MSGRARGWCSGCEKDRTGRIVGDVSQNSGPGQTVIICDSCDAALKAKHAALRLADDQVPLPAADGKSARSGRSRLGGTSDGSSDRVQSSL